MPPLAALLGSADVTLRDGTFRLPDGFAAAFVGGLVVTSWLDGCLALWPRAEWDAFAARLVRLPVADAGARWFARLLFASAVEIGIVPDDIALPEPQRRSAGLDGEVVLVGAGDHAELWSRGRWDEQSSRSLDELSGALAS
jgi:MraZ protein